MALIPPSAAYRIDDYAEAARRLGAELAVAAEVHHSLAEEMGASLIPIDFADPDEAALRIAAARPGRRVARTAPQPAGGGTGAPSAGGRVPLPRLSGSPSRRRPGRRRCLSQLRLGW